MMIVLSVMLIYHKRSVLFLPTPALLAAVVSHTVEFLHP